MPIFLWKDRSERAGFCFDLSTLKQQYITDGLKVARSLKKESGTLAIWLSGPFDMSRVSSASDLHMAVLSRRAKSNFYRHQLSRFSEVGRRLEIAFFPAEYLQSILDNGYSNWGEVFDLYKLYDIEVLYDRDEVLSNMRRKLLTAAPRPLFVGRQIDMLKQELTHLREFIDNGTAGEAVLTARKIVTASLMLRLVAAKGCMSSKLSHLYAELKSDFPTSQVEAFETAEALVESGKENAARYLDIASDLTRQLFARRGICVGASS